MILINILLSFLLLCIALALVFAEHNFKIIAYFATFSLTAACLYFINHAPDIALAEIAVGCAFIPLIFTIAVTRLNSFIVIFFHNENEQAYCDPDVMLEFMVLAERFCAENGLKLKILTKPIAYMPDIRGVFRPGNIDVIADYQSQKGILKLVGNRRNVFIPRFAVVFRNRKNMRFIDTEAERYED